VRVLRNPRSSGGGSVVTTLLPWVAIAGLVYLMATNKPAAKGGATTSGSGCAGLPLPPATRTIYTPPGCTTNDFGLTASSSCWCG
jgi:hypothetical protein